MKVKTFFEISDGGFSVNKMNLNEANKVVAMAFTEKEKTKGECECAIIGTFGAKDVEGLAVATADALAKITDKFSDPAPLWTMFEKRYRMEMEKHCITKMKELEEKMRGDFEASGHSKESIDNFFNMMNAIIKEEG